MNLKGKLTISENWKGVLMNRETNDEKILIVDDEEDICFLLRGILNRETNASIDVATSFVVAKEKLKKNNYQLVFLDVRLGNDSGFDLVDYIQKPENGTYITMISAYNSSADLARMHNSAIDWFLPKPLSRSKILDCLEKAQL